MKTYLFYDSPEYDDTFSKKIINVIKKIACTSDTENLIIAVYILNSCHYSFGTTYTKQFTPDKFATGRGKWKFSKKWNTPEDLPENFCLIRICLGQKILFPVKEKDKYGWELTFGSIYDKLAFIFAHELHHYRRYHLSMHPGQGEQSANKWALERSSECDFNVKGKKIPVKRIHRKKNKLLFDPFKKFRSLNQGDRVLIITDPKNRYKNEIAEVVKPIRKNSKRIVIKTPDKKIWRWPMNWLKPL